MKKTARFIILTILASMLPPAYSEQDNLQSNDMEAGPLRLSAAAPRSVKADEPISIYWKPTVNLH